jgi:CDP-glycerol glycerophosphotransferase
LAIPDEIYQLDAELSPVVTVEAMAWTRHGLRVDGSAYVAQLGAPERHSQRIRAVAVAARRRRLRVPLRLRPVHRPDLTADAGGTASLDWSGFSVVLPRGLLRLAALVGVDRWQIELELSTQGLTRTATAWRMSRTLDRAVTARRFGAGRVMCAELSVGSGLTVGIQPEPPRLTSIDVSARSLHLTGRCGGLDEPMTVSLSGGRSSQEQLFPASSKAGNLTCVVPLSAVATESDLAEEWQGAGEDDDVEWAVRVQDRHGASHELVVDLTEPAPVWPLAGGRELVAYATNTGGLQLIERATRPVVDEVSWTADGELVLAGHHLDVGEIRQVVLRSRRAGEEHRVGIDVDVDGGRFVVRFPPAAMPGRFGPLPLQPGSWALYLADDRKARVPFAAEPGLLRQPPADRAIRGRMFSVRRSGAFGLELVALSDLAIGDRGGPNQHRLQSVRYPSARSLPLRDAVTYLSFNGRQYSDSPRAIYQELSGRDLGLEQLWVVRQGRCRVSGSATVLRERSEAYHDALATSRLIVTNDYLPPWFRRRAGQVVLQTWHGHPLKLIGRDKAEVRTVVRQAEQWTHVLSPSPVATPILAGALEVTGRMLETGYPRTDVLLGSDLASRAAAVRERIGIPAGKRAVLYMPTYRDQLSLGKARYGLNQDLDLELLRRELSEDHVLLFRKHHYVVGASLTDSDEFVIDVSGYPDATELLLAADVLVTDYSSAMFDWMSTGRPIVYFVPDLEYYRDVLRGFYFDLEAIGPGRFARTSAAVVDAVREADTATATFSDRYQAFRSTYCSLDDGAASARVVAAMLAALDGDLVD